MKRKIKQNSIYSHLVLRDVTSTVCLVRSTNGNEFSRVYNLYHRAFICGLFLKAKGIIIIKKKSYPYRDRVALPSSTAILISFISGPTRRFFDLISSGRSLRFYWLLILAGSEKGTLANTIFACLPFRKPCSV